MSEFIPTEEQLAIDQAVHTTRDNLFIEAFAGSAKSTTIAMVAKPGDAVLAFNKHAKEDLKKKVKPGVEPLTINGLGHRALLSYFPRAVSLDPKKSWKVMELLSKQAREDVTPFYEAARNEGLWPKDAGFDKFYPRPILRDVPESWDYIAQRYDLRLHPTIISMCRTALIRDIQFAFSGTATDKRHLIDFNDQVWLPAILPVNLPNFKNVFVDEAQDLTPLNAAIVGKLDSRVVAVGDRRQSIYAFRGAMTDAVDYLIKRFDMKTLKLTTCFRCSKEVVAEVKRRCPQLDLEEFKPWDQAPDGDVVSLPEGWTAADIGGREQVAVLCRNNAPLFTLAFRLLRAGFGVKVQGSDIGRALDALLKRALPANDMMPIEGVKAGLRAWEKQQKDLAQEKDNLAIAEAAADRVESLIAAADANNARTLGELKASLKRLFSADGAITLSTVHKAKGLEWKNIFLLDEHRIPSPWAFSEEELRQEDHILYVALTRPKLSLTYINLEDMESPE